MIILLNPPNVEVGSLDKKYLIIYKVIEEKSTISLVSLPPPAQSKQKVKGLGAKYSLSGLILSKKNNFRSNYNITRQIFSWREVRSSIRRLVTCTAAAQY